MADEKCNKQKKKKKNLVPKLGITWVASLEMSNYEKKSFQTLSLWIYLPIIMCLFNELKENLFSGVVV